MFDKFATAVKSKRESESMIAQDGIYQVLHVRIGFSSSNKYIVTEDNICIRLVLQRCVPINISSLIDLAQENNVDLDSIISPARIKQLPRLITEMRLFVEASAVTYERGLSYCYLPYLLLFIIEYRIFLDGGKTI